jgi:hypothetical protein
MSLENKSLKIDYPDKYFRLLYSNFWDSLNNISNHHQTICKYLLENTPENYENIILKVTESLKTIAQIDLRYFYILYLKYSFCLSEPLTLNQLKNNFKKKIFPFYLFTLITKKKEINHLMIDFLEKKIIILNKDKKIQNLNQDKILSISKKMNTSIIISLNEKDPNTNTNKQIEIFPEFFLQVDLIYTIMDFFAKEKKEKNKNIPEEAILHILDDDTYVPKGILLRTHILKEHQNKLLSKDKRYAVLGPSLIIIFKDNTMKEIRNIIPLLPFETQLISDDKDFILTFKYINRDQSLTFLDENIYLEWKNTLKDIFNKKIVEKIDGIVMYQTKEKKLNSKILNLINEDIEELEEKISKNKDYLENFKISFVQEKNEN